MEGVKTGPCAVALLWAVAFNRVFNKVDNFYIFKCNENPRFIISFLTENGVLK